MQPRKESVAFIINYQDHVLLGKKASGIDDSLAGKWHIPAGTKKLGETDLAAIVREAKEETLLIVQPGKFISKYTTDKGTLLRWYECAAPHGLPKARSDLVAVRWVLPKEVKNYLEPSVYASWTPQLHAYFAQEKLD